MIARPGQTVFAFEGPQEGGPTFVFKSNPPELLRGAERVDLKPQTLKLLKFFIENAGAVFSREVIVEDVWENPDIDLGNVNKQVQLLRDAIGPWCIVTVTKSGYRFGAEPRAASEQELQRPQPSTPASLPGTDISSPPYVGPQPFTTEQAHLFFGRDRECAELIQCVVRGEKRAVLLHSPSGAGKSSLINTALRGGLAKLGFRVLPVARVGAHLERLPTGRPRDAENLYTASAIASMGEDAGLDWALTSNWTAYLTAASAGGGLVLILDQIEEILTTRPLGPPTHRREFFLQLRDAVRDLPNLRVLLAFRQEYLSELARAAADLEPYWTLFRLDPLSQVQAREAIVRPANDVYDVGFVPQVVDALVEELARHRYTDGVGHHYDEPGDSIEPLQLQVVCEALWNRLPRTRVDRISWREIDQALPGGARGEGMVRARDAVTTFVDSVLQDFCGKAIDEIAKAKMFPVELIDLGCRQFMTQRGIRLLVYRNGDYTGTLPNHIVDDLARHHLLRIEERYGERAYELAHDTLIEPIRVRGELVDGQRLQDLWRRSIREIAASERACAEGLDEDMLIEGCFLDFIDDTGSPLRISAHNAQRAKLTPRTVEMLSDKGLVRRMAEGYTLSNPELAAALHQIRCATKDHDLRPLTSVARIVFVSAAAIGTTVLVTMLTRAVVAGCRLTLTQAPDVGAFAGWFQGVVGAMIWSALVAAALSRRWYVADRGRPRARYPWLRWGMAGAAAGLLGGVFITIALMKAQTPDTLRSAGWTVDDSLMSAFTRTGFGWTMLLFGPAVGWGCGVATIRILLSREWRLFVTRPKPSSMGRTGRVWVKSMYLALMRSGYVFLPIALAASVLYSLVSSLSKTPPVLSRIIGESLSIAFGDIGLVAGLLFGLYLVEKGVDIRAEDTGTDSES